MGPHCGVEGWGKLGGREDEKGQEIGEIGSLR